MHFSRFFHRGIVLVALLALVMPLAALADGGKRGNDGCSRCDDRVFYATNTAGKLLRFSSDEPRRLRSKQITRLPIGVTIKGIDFRPASGDLYALGSDRVVYRLNPGTAIAVPEGKSFDQSPPILSGSFNGLDFNPTVDKIRVTSDAGENLRLNPDDGTLLTVDTKLTPAGVQVVGSAYTNSSFTAFATRPDGDRALRLRRRRQPGPVVDPAAGERGHADPAAVDRTGARRQRRLRHRRRAQRRLARGHPRGSLLLPPLSARRQHGPDEVLGADR
jgi:Domain of unknown function (DUF4394)